MQRLQKMLTSPSIPHNYQQPRLQRMERRFPQQTTWCGHPRSPARRRLSHRARRLEPPQTTPLAYGTKGTCERSKNKVERYRSETRKTPLCSGLITPRITGSIGARTDTPGVTNWNGPYWEKGTVPKDPWGNEYKYVSPG